MDCALPDLAGLPHIKRSLQEGLVLAPGEQVDVTVSCFFIDVLDISAPNKSFNADLVLEYQWNDPRLAKRSESGQEFSEDELWQPEILITNLGDAEEEWETELEVLEAGTVRIIRRWSGNFTTKFDLREFPKDTQELDVHLLARNEAETSIRLNPNTDRSGRAESFSVTNWKVGELQILEAPYSPSGDLKTLSGIRFQLSAQRYIGYYVGTIMATTTIIVCMAWLVFWIDPSALNPRVSISVTSMLTLIAHRFVIQRELPNLPYLTSMDVFLLGCTALILVGLAMVVYVINIDALGDRERARKVNKIFRYLYPIPFLALLFIAL